MDEPPRRGQRRLSLTVSLNAPHQGALPESVAGHGKLHPRDFVYGSMSLLTYLETGSGQHISQTLIRKLIGRKDAPKNIQL